MQELLVSFVLLAAVWIVFKHMAPRSLCLYLNRAGMQIAKAMDWESVTEKLVEKRRQMAGESSCITCHGCTSRQQAKCEIRIRPEDSRKQ